MHSPFASTMCLALVATAAAGENEKPLAVGDKAPAWANLPGVDDKKLSLSDFKDAAVVVVTFTCNSCPYSTAYEDRLIKFAAEYKEKGVRLVAINVTRDEGESLGDMKKRAMEKKFNFPYLLDASQNLGRDYGAVVTPHVFVVDKEGVVAYMGAFDNSRTEAKATKHYLRDAVDAVLAGKKPAVAETRATGCRIVYE